MVAPALAKVEGKTAKVVLPPELQTYPRQGQIRFREHDANTF